MTSTIKHYMTPQNKALTKRNTKYVFQQSKTLVDLDDDKGTKPLLELRRLEQLTICINNLRQLYEKMKTWTRVNIDSRLTTRNNLVR